MARPPAATGRKNSRSRQARITNYYFNSYGNSAKKTRIKNKKLTDFSRDNSEAERKMYMAALGRKNNYGSDSVWNGHFTACLFSLFQTTQALKYRAT